MRQQGKPFLVETSRNRKHSSSVEERLWHGDLYADLIIDRSVEPPIHHWIIQRYGSPEIMFWDMSFDGVGAEDRVRWHLDYFWKDVKSRERDLAIA